VNRVRWMGWAAIASAFVAGPALAKSLWWDEARIGVKVHDHAFHRVTANAIGCQVRVRLYFDAPFAGYQEPAPERNHFRFTAQVTLSDDQRFVSEAFDNIEAGARVFAFSHDSRDEGCWAKLEHTLRKVDVHACRGVGCVPKPFE
jgi:hypothetical protein